MLYIISGASGSGKSTIGKYMETLGIKKVVSHTTRDIRKGEIDGIDYHFTSIEEFEKLDKLETIKYSGNYYGFSMEVIDNALNSSDDYYAIVEFNGQQTFINHLEESKLTTIFIDVDVHTMKTRMEMRGDSEQNINNRIEYHYNIVENEEKARKNAEYIINNDGEWSNTIAQLNKIINKTILNSKSLSSGIVKNKVQFDTRELFDKFKLEFINNVGEIDFNKFYPVPNTVIGGSEEHFTKYGNVDNEHNSFIVTDEIRNDFIEDTVTSVEWCEENWGTTSNAFDTKLNDLSVEFKTYNDGCIPLLARFLDSYPNEKFKYSYTKDNNLHISFPLT